ncbi:MULTISPECIES: helix-turn-helix transcriptional regulator [unclassified Arcicella]|uniref:AraC family transcriptional regulator n=1 Tax=unclassified Arcicella TaxID=2644986 RepID=UPI00285AA107|nr:MULTISPECIES: helix-turn-helix transcriptional regulator [unclassified Arcicella]MDR6564247.1 AraC-like DNA-binding protein [Arcicella sp. BE51]MDR6811506.1 AraC-like DNA-binding protein [Arcicella sp. BE140]MDR6823032.1 AraC-like DNA-binding protein [Arcicella sp. BE139]
MKIKADIPVFNQSSEAIGGIYIAKLSVEDVDYHEDKRGVHRDDFFIFFVITSGSVMMQCDTVNIEIESPSVLLMKPFQIHAVQQVSAGSSGYFISIAPFLIPNLCSEIFQNLKISEQVKKIEEVLQEDLMANIALLNSVFTKNQLYNTQIINGLFNALVYQFSNLFQSSEIHTPERKNQSSLITTNFKKLIAKNNFLESPSFFAKELNISTTHLNDCVSLTTGKSVTYWLQNAMLLEAQRLLYYTENEVKEIAYHLGFKDHSYFSRLFKKISNETPLGFRNKFRE